MARGKRALLIALLVAGSLLAALGATARELWLEAREVEIDLHEGPIHALAALGSDTVVCGLDDRLEAVQVPGGEVCWRASHLGARKIVAGEGFVAVRLAGSLGYEPGIRVLHNGQVVRAVGLESPPRPEPPSLGLLPSKRPGGARLAWIDTDERGGHVRARELTGKPDVQIGPAARWLAVSGNRLFALGEDGLLSLDPWTLAGEKVADGERTNSAQLVAGPRGVAWKNRWGDALRLWRLGAASDVILSEDDDVDDASPMAFDDSGELLATISQKTKPGAETRDWPWPYWVGLYDLERKKWWRREILGAAAVAFVGDRLVVGDALGRLHVLPTPRARFQRSWQPGAR